MQATVKEAFYIACITLLLFFTCAVSWGEIPQTLAERVARVFPFQVGQQYEFKSAADFTTVEGDVLSAGTVATITIEDTVFNDTTYLHIPYWANLGTGYYRLDEDSTKIWNRHPGTGEEAVFLYLGHTEDYGPVLGFGDIGGYHTYDRLIANPECITTPCDTMGRLMIPLHWAYPDLLNSYDMMMRHPCSTTGWFPEIYPDRVITSKTAALGYRFSSFIRDFRAYTLYGALSPGDSYHYMNSVYTVCAHFRPVSSEPWPTLSDHVVSVLQSSQPSQINISAYPNPFNPLTTITYSLPEAAYVRLNVMNVNGQPVRTLVNTSRETGNHQIIWDGADNNGQPVTSGVYLCRLITGEMSRTLRILLVR